MSLRFPYIMARISADASVAVVVALAPAKTYTERERGDSDTHRSHFAPEHMGSSAGREAQYCLDYQLIGRMLLANGIE
jgi:hypothetical protein